MGVSRECHSDISHLNDNAAGSIIKAGSGSITPGITYSAYPGVWAFGLALQDTLIAKRLAYSHIHVTAWTWFLLVRGACPDYAAV